MILILEDDTGKVAINSERILTMSPKKNGYVIIYLAGASPNMSYNVKGELEELVDRFNTGIR